MEIKTVFQIVNTLLIVCFYPLSFVEADSIELSAIRDTTLYENNFDFSNGSGLFFFAGNNGNGSARRAMIMFDIDAIPSGATINSVTLGLFNSQTNAGFEDISVHRVTRDWGEAGSAAPMGEGGGTQAETGDATWSHNFYSDQLWENAGGDFVSDASATQSVGDIGQYEWQSAILAQDVQSWLDGGTGNFGWALIGNESNTPSAKRFVGRSGEFFTPTLVVDFTAVPEPTCLPLLFLALLTSCRRRTHRQ